MDPTSRSPFAAPGETGRGLWRACAEVLCGGLLILATLPVTMDTGDVPPPEVQLLLVLVGLALFAVRRRFPVVSLLALSVVVGLLPAVGLPLAVTAYTTTKRMVTSRRRTGVLLTSTVLTVLACTFLGPLVGLGGAASGFALGAVLAATTLIVPGLVGISGGQQDRLMRALQERATAAEAARRLAESESRIHERSRIAAEMHDLVGHRLSLISLHTGGLEMALEKESPELRDEAALVRRATGDAMRELREVLGVLGPFDKDTGSDALTDTTGTRADVEALAEESRGGGIPVELTWEGPDVNDRVAQVRRAVHRVVRESLTNVHRYAAGARVTVAVTHTDDCVEVRVRNGRPPVAPEAVTGLGSGRGLVGLRERVALLGGALEAGPTPFGGFAVTARIPARPGPGASLAATGTAEPASPSEPSARPAAARVQRRVVGTLTGLLGLAGVGVMMLFGLFLVNEATPRPGDLPPEEPRIGMSREKVEYAVSGDLESVRAAATGREPARPRGATRCIYPLVPLDDYSPLPERPGGKRAEPGEGPGHLKITRYCFRADKLAAIDRFTVPVVSTTPPWETP